MKPLDRLTEMARRSPKLIALAEGEDPRVIEAAIRVVCGGVASIALIGDATTIRSGLVGQGADPDRFRIEGPRSSTLTPVLAESYHALRASKGVDADAALKAVQTPLVFAGMMVRQGHADGTVGGAVSTTADVVRAALQTIGPAPGIKLVSSFFLMMLCQPHHQKKGAFVFADCGLVVDPDAGALSDIARMSAKSYAALTAGTPKVAMLSFSTNGSATHASISKVIAATRQVRASDPDLAIDGELQFDAAFVASISASKTPNSPLNGEANVFVFPNLDSANIGYKIAQRIGGATAIGPIMQGLAKPANDLSRGCTTDDIFHMIVITAVQAGQQSRQASVQEALHPMAMWIGKTG